MFPLQIRKTMVSPGSAAAMLAMTLSLLPRTVHAQESEPWLYGEEGNLYYGYCSPDPDDYYEAQTCASYYVECVDNEIGLTVAVSDVGDDTQEGPDGRKILYDLMNGYYEDYEDFTGLLIVQPQNLQTPLYFNEVKLGSPGGDTPVRVLLTSSHFEAFDAAMSVPGVKAADLRIGRTDIRLFSSDSERQTVLSFITSCTVR